MSGFFGGGSSPTNAPPVYSGLNVGTSQFNMPVPIFWGQRRLSTNAIWFNNFQKTPVSGKGKGGGGKGDQAYDYSAAVELGLCEGPIDSTQNIWANGSTTTTTTLSALNMTLFSGTLSQSPWSYVTTNYPAEALAYSQTAYLGCPKMDLGESATIQDNAFECIRTAFASYVHSSDGWVDPATHIASPGSDVLLSDIIPDFLTNVQYGMGFVSGDIGSLTQFAAYQRAQGLFFSPLLNSQEKATDILDRWAQLSNSWIYWSGTALQFVPLGDSAVTGNGVTYTPQNDVAYNLTLSDFVTDGKDPPVKVTRKDPADCYNRTQLDITDRTLGYIDNPFEFKDQTLVDQYGQRDNTSVQADEICDPNVARVVVQLIGKRAAYIRNEYSFKTSYRFVLCLPGTVLTLTEPNIGLNAFRVRVKGPIQKDDQGNLTFTCEEFPGTVGTYVPPAGTAAVVTPNNPNQNELPGAVNTPAIIEPDSAFTGGVPKIIIAASGGDQWGGCTVNLSFDDLAYSQIGVISSAARQGVLTSGLAAFGGTNPDTSHTLAVDCTESLAALTPVTNADAQALRSLALVVAQPTPSGGAEIVPTNGELLAFGALTATGTYTANLTYLERGQYGTTAGAHSTGDQFTAIDVLGTDGTSIAFELPPSYVGKTLYIKLASFNRFGGSLQDLSTCAAYVYVPTGAGYGGGSGGVPFEPTGLAAPSPSATQVPLSWDANPSSDGVTSYTLYRASGTGQAFGSASPIWTGSALSYIDTGVTPSSGYTYFLVANNAVGASANTSGLNATTPASGSTYAQVIYANSSPWGPLGQPPALNWLIDFVNTTGAAIIVYMPTSPVTGQVITIFDAGSDASADNITIKLFGGGTLAVINTDNGQVTKTWNGSAWV